MTPRPNFGLLLWNVFQNELVYNTDKSGIKIYQMTIKCMFVVKAMEDVERTFMDEGREISNWYQLNLFKCNPDKFQYIRLGQRHINEATKKIKYVKSGTEIKLLGITFDEHLKCTSHLDELSKRVSGKTGVLMRLKNLIPT